MKIKVTHTQAAAGHDVMVRVDGENEELVASVNVSINGSTLDDERFSPPNVSYGGAWRDKGYFPGTNEVKVTVADQTGKTHVHTERWHD